MILKALNANRYQLALRFYRLWPIGFHCQWCDNFEAEKANGVKLDLKNNKIRGLRSEYLVAKTFKNQGGLELAHRFKTPFAEVDLIFCDQDFGLHLVEVKSIQCDDFDIHWISKHQLRRLKNAAYYFQSDWPQQVELHAALVRQDSSVEVYSVS